MEGVAATTKIWKNHTINDWSAVEIGKLRTYWRSPMLWVTILWWMSCLREQFSMQSKGKLLVGQATKVEKYCSMHGQCHHDTSECYRKRHSKQHLNTTEPMRTRTRAPVHVGNHARDRGRGHGLIKAPGEFTEEEEAQARCSVLCVVGRVISTSHCKERKRMSINE